MTRKKLARFTVEELTRRKAAISSDPENICPDGSFTEAAQKKLDRISYAMAHRVPDDLAINPPGRYDDLRC